MESYILHIYRYEPQTKHRIVGTVQELNKTTRIAFTSVDELWNVLQERLARVELMENSLPEALSEDSEA